MNNRVIVNRPLQRQRSIDETVIAGLLLRLALTILIVALNDSIVPYFLEDDLKYEYTADRYMKVKQQAFDFDMMERLTQGYAQPFWPYVMCLLAEVTGLFYAGRFLNVILSTACIKLVYNVTGLLTGSEKSAMLAGRLFAFLPITVLTACFPLKDIFLTFAFLYVFHTFLLIYYKRKLTATKILFSILGLIGIYNTRGSVVELMGMFFAIYLLDGYLKRKQHLKALAVIGLAVVAFVLFREQIMEAFVTKIEDYAAYNQDSEGLLSKLQMQNWWEFYKLPFAYIFATFQPMTLNLLNLDFSNFWASLIYLLNVSIYPVAIANTLYIFRKKHNGVFWLTGVVMYCAIASLCLGVFRHYLFLLPLVIINCALFFDRADPKDKKIVAYGTLAAIVVVLAYSIYQQFTL